MALRMGPRMQLKGGTATWHYAKRIILGRTAFLCSTSFISYDAVTAIPGGRPINALFIVFLFGTFPSSVIS